MARAQSFTILTLLSLSAVTTSTQGSAQDLAKYIGVGMRQMKAHVDVNGLTGTSPTFDFSIQQNDTSGASGWADVQTFTQKTTNGNEDIHFTPTKRYIRAVTTAGGTSPSANLTVVVLAELRIK